MGQNIGWYRRLVLLCAVLGYAFLWLLLLLCVLCTVGIVVHFVSDPRHATSQLKVLIALALIEFQIMRAFIWRPGKPGGYYVSPGELSKLRAEVDRLQVAVGAPKIHRLVIADLPNMYILQRPRLGLFGWYENFLVIGYPYLKLMPTDEWRAVIAHELGHLSHAHGKSGAWIYRTRRTWYAFAGNSQLHKWNIVGKIFEFFITRFDQLSFQLARRQEYEADRRSAEVVSPQALGGALIRSSLIDSALEDIYWPKIWEGSRRGIAIDTVNPYSEMAPYNSVMLLRPTQARARIEEQLRIPESTTDVHPSLPDRLSAIGVKIELPVDGGSTAAQDFLEPEEDVLLGRVVDANWREAAFPTWVEETEKRVARQLRFEALCEQHRSGLLTEEEHVDMVDFALEFETNSAAKTLSARELCLRMPKSAIANFILGRALYEQQDPECVERLMAACRLDGNYFYHTVRMAEGFFEDQGRDAELAELRKGVQSQQDVYQKAIEERHSIGGFDPIEPISLDDKTAQAYADILNSLGLAGRAWVVLKRAKYLVDWNPPFVLAVELTEKYKKLWGRDAERQAMDVLWKSFTDHKIFLFYVVHPDKDRLSDELRALPNFYQK